MRPRPRPRPAPMPAPSAAASTATTATTGRSRLQPLHADREPVEGCVARNRVALALIGEVVQAHTRMQARRAEADAFAVMPPSMGKAHHTGHDAIGGLD